MLSITIDHSEPDHQQGNQRWQFGSLLQLIHGDNNPSPTQLLVAGLTCHDGYRDGLFYRLHFRRRQRIAHPTPPRPERPASSYDFILLRHGGMHHVKASAQRLCGRPVLAVRCRGRAPTVPFRDSRIAEHFNMVPVKGGQATSAPGTVLYWSPRLNRHRSIVACRSQRRFRRVLGVDTAHPQPKGWFGQRTIAGGLSEYINPALVAHRERMLHSFTAPAALFAE
jgi:hypothetical protein